MPDNWLADRWRASAGVLPGRSPSTARVVAHNAFWFQGVPFPGDQPPAANPAVLEQLVDVYRALKPDALCVQEVQDRATAAALASRLDLHFLYRPGAAYPQYGGAVLSPWPLIAVQTPHAAAVDRVLQPVWVHIDPKAPLLVVNVHLPSNRQRGASGGAAQRAQEARWIAEPDPGDGCSPHVALGDFNEPPDRECGQLLAEAGYRDAALVAGLGDVSTNVKGAKRGDQAWVRHDLARHLHGYFCVGMEPLPARSLPNTFLSDHLPLGIDIAWPGADDATRFARGSSTTRRPALVQTSARRRAGRL